MDIYLKLFEVLFPVFFIVGIGFLLGKKKNLYGDLEIYKVKTKNINVYPIKLKIITI